MTFLNLDIITKPLRKYKAQLEESIISNDRKDANSEESAPANYQEQKIQYPLADLPEFGVSKSTMVFKIGITKLINNCSKWKNLHMLRTYF